MSAIVYAISLVKADVFRHDAAKSWSTHENAIIMLHSRASRQQIVEDLFSILQVQFIVQQQKPQNLKTFLSLSILIDFVFVINCCVFSVVQLLI